MSNNGKRIAWVTGGGSGIGLAGAEALAGDGWRVTISGRRGARCVGRGRQTHRRQDVRKGRCPSAGCDPGGRRADRRRGSILARQGQIDLLVNNAGLNVPKRSWKDLEIGGWDQIVDVNLSGVFYAIHAVLPAMRERKSGSIINVASWAGRYRIPDRAGPAYTATKHAILALTHSFNMDECRNGLRACCLSPGEVATPIMKNRRVPPSQAVMSKMLQPEDVGRTIAFVANMPPLCLRRRSGDQSDVANRAFIQTPHSRD